jgi:hypothetical protein
VLKERVRELRPAYLPADPVGRTVYEPGELPQCDLWSRRCTSRSATDSSAARRCWS